MDIRELKKNVNTARVSNDFITQTQNSKEDINLNELPNNEEMLKEIENYLESKGLTKEDILAILDSMITDQTVYWEFNLLNRVPVVFKLRPSWVNEYIVGKLEEEKPELMVSYNYLIAKLNLAGSLYKYNNKIIFDGSEESFNRSLSFVDSLPYTIFSKLVEELAVFDRVVNIATMDWVIEAFTKPQ